jgi:hypothetical protein
MTRCCMCVCVCGWVCVCAACMPHIATCCRDYQVQVHIIEARELKSENLNGTSDPIVFVECFKQKRNTAVISNVSESAASLAG